MMGFSGHSAAFLCYFFHKNSAVRYLMHVLENISIIDNMILRVLVNVRIYLKSTFYIFKEVSCGQVH